MGDPYDVEAAYLSGFPKLGPPPEGGVFSVIHGTGYGSVPDITIRDPVAASIFGEASEWSWPSGLASEEARRADIDRMKTGGYHVAREHALEDRASARRLGQISESLARSKAGLFERFAKDPAGFLASLIGGGGEEHLNINSLIQQILAPLRRQQGEQTAQAQQDFRAGGRNIGGNTAWQQILGELGSRQGEDVGALSAKAMLGILPTMVGQQEFGQSQAMQILRLLMGQ